MDDLQAKAIEAVRQAEADAGSISLKVRATKILRDATGAYLRDIIPAVDWAMSRPHPVLTRADKERAVRLMTDRVVEAADQYAHTNLEGTIEECLGWLHTRERRRKALLRVAMARTVD